jgi:glucan phosphoethanolaminetransferase (alkaline phosphatase superfamily)
MNRWKAFLLHMPAEERRWLILRSLCALIWAMELFWVQSLAFEAAPWIRYPIVTQMIRFYLDLVLTLLLSLLLQRRYLTPLLVLNVILLTIVGAYTVYFHRPLMIVNACYRWREGWSLRTHAADVIPFRIIGVVLAAFALKFWLLLKSGRSHFPRWVRWQVAVVAIVLYALPVGALQFTQLKLATDGNMRRAVYAYGYTIPWIIDSIVSVNLDQVAERAKAYADMQFDRLTPLEKPVGIRSHLIVLQLETIGTQALEASFGGVPLMPFLQEIQSRSMYFRIQSFHTSGSCDMDFAAATFTRPYPFLVPYQLPGIQYTNSMPSFMKRYGFSTYVFHGNTQLFYDRGPLMERLGFDHIFFKEQLTSRHLRSSIMGVRDPELFRCILEVLRSEQRAYVFVITLDTHTPYNLLEDSEMEVFPRPTNQVERYLNSIRYLDNCLRDFISQLPEGTTLVLYGDHTASIKSEIFVSDIVEGMEYVGCMIYQKGNDLSRFQQTRGQAASTNGMFNLLDILSYVRNSVTASSNGSLSAGALLSTP